MANRSINRFIVTGPVLAVLAAARRQHVSHEVREDGAWIFDVPGHHDTTTYHVGDDIAVTDESLHILCLHCPEVSNFTPAGLARWERGVRVQTLEF